MDGRGRSSQLRQSLSGVASRSVPSFQSTVVRHQPRVAQLSVRRAGARGAVPNGAHQGLMPDHRRQDTGALGTGLRLPRFAPTHGRPEHVRGLAGSRLRQLARLVPEHRRGWSRDRGDINTG